MCLMFAGMMLLVGWAVGIVLCVIWAVAVESLEKWWDRQLDLRREADEFKEDATERIYQLDTEIESKQKLIAMLRHQTRTLTDECSDLRSQLEEDQEKADEAVDDAYAEGRANADDEYRNANTELKADLQLLGSYIVSSHGNSASARAFAENLAVAHRLSLDSAMPALSSDDDDDDDCDEEDAGPALAALLSKYVEVPLTAAATDSKSDGGAPEPSVAAAAETNEYDLDAVLRQK